MDTLSVTIAWPAAAVATCAATLLERRFGCRVEDEDLADIAAAEAGEGRDGLSEELSRARAEGLLSPVACEAAQRAGVVGEEEIDGAYRDRYALVARVHGRAVPYAAFWAVGGACALAACAAAGAGPLATCSGACLLASAALDGARRTVSPGLAMAQAALGCAAAGAGAAPAALAFAACLAAFSVFGAAARRRNAAALGRGDAWLMAAAAAPAMFSVARACALCGLLVAVLGAQAAWLRGRGRRGEPQPLACSLALPYLAAMCL